jgi:hypothetical protein
VLGATLSQYTAGMTIHRLCSSIEAYPSCVTALHDPEWPQDSLGSLYITWKGFAG